MKTLASNPVNITVVTQPTVIQKGQLLEVSVALTTTGGASVAAARVYMEIVDSRGRVVWPLSVLAKDTSGFSRLISTSELKTNTRYMIRVSHNNKLIRMGYTFFKTAKNIFPFALIPGAISTLALIPKSAQKASAYVWETEQDSHVCPICLNLAGRVWKADDPNIPRVGPAEFGGDTHWGCRCNLAIIGILNAALQKAKRMRAAALSVGAVQNHLRQLGLIEA